MMERIKIRVGVDLGGTKMLIILADEEGRELFQKKFPSRATEGPAVILEHLLICLAELLQEKGLSFREIEGIGLCIAGFYNKKTGMMFSSPNLPGWECFPLEQELKRIFSCPLVVENDANAAAYGEYRLGAGRGRGDMVKITLGTGIGGGLVLGGKLYRGSNGFAGEIGHIPLLPHGPLCGCGRRGCLETLASGTAIAREGKELLRTGRKTLLREMVGAVEELEASHIFKAAGEGDEEAAKIVERAAYFLGLGLAIVTGILNPELIVLGGGVAAFGGENFLQRVRLYLKDSLAAEISSYVSVVAAGLGEKAGALGILALLGDLLAES